MAKIIEMLVEREPTVNGATLGKLLLNGEVFCDTLEDEIREIENVDVSKWKQYGRTAIPAGTYSITLEDSPRFGPDTLTVNGVHGFDKIRIHAGNTQEDTHGCLLLGVRNTATTISNSRVTLSALKTLLVAELKAGTTVLLTYRNPA